MSTSNADSVAADMAAWATFTRDAVHKTVVTFGALLQTNVKRRASEARTNPRPSPNIEGPRLLTGNYNRSINRRTTRFAGRSISEVGTNAVQGPRLEMGFDGVDSAGRTVHQQPYPHFGPGLDDTAPAFAAALDGVLAAAIAPRIAP